MTRVLLLGGTTEATRLAAALAEAGIAAVFSYAGRTARPIAQPLPTRIGGFGGPEGLATFLRREAISHLIDATHPFAANMSRNAIAAGAATGTPLIRLERPPWQAQAGDNWQHVRDLAAAAAALPRQPGRIFLAIGRQHLAPFAARPEHFYLLRFVDAPADRPTLPHARIVLARGPFSVAADRALLQEHAITHLVAKNSGGEGARAKLDAARELGLPVILIDRPQRAGRPPAHSIDEVMRWLAHPTRLGV